MSQSWHCNSDEQESEKELRRVSRVVSLREKVTRLSRENKDLLNKMHEIEQDRSVSKTIVQLDSFRWVTSSPKKNINFEFKKNALRLNCDVLMMRLILYQIVFLKMRQFFSFSLPKMGDREFVEALIVLHNSLQFFSFHTDGFNYYRFLVTMW